MNAANLARTAYGSSAAPIRTPQSIELALFTRTTHRLKSAAERGKPGFAELASAIHDNRKLWSTLAADVASEGNSLPPALRARIFYLAEFTDHHSKLVLRRKAGVAPLIQVNAAIMRGLSSEGTPL